MKHGTPSGYVHGCRCDDCRTAHADYQRARRARLRGVPCPPPRAQVEPAAHGTENRYLSGCSCDWCRHAHAVAQRGRRTQKRRALAKDPGSARHGTVVGYRQDGCRCDACAEAAARKAPHGTPNGYKHYGCRCDECRTAFMDRQRASRLRKPPTLG